MSGGDWSPPCRWRTCPRCTPSQWWTDAGIGCCWGKWWTGAVSGLRCSCLGYWMRSACGSSTRILQRAAYVKGIRKSSKEERKGKALTLLLSFFCRFLTGSSVTIFSSPSHLSPCLTSPNSISPQWSQKAGARYECTLSACGRIWKSSDFAAAGTDKRGENAVTVVI